MTGGSSSAPTFNAQAAAQDQTKSNVNTAIAQTQLNSTNQVTPYGTLTYNQTGGSYDNMGNWIPQYTATQTMSPDQGAIYNDQVALQKQALGQIAPGVLDQIQSTTSKPLNFDNAPAMPTDQTAAINDAYNALMSRQNQNFNQQTSATRAQLANQGINPGTTAYDNAMRPIQQAQTDAVNQAQLNATSLAGQNINQAQQLRNQAINEDTTLYNQPLNTYAALTGVSGGVTNPSFVSTPQSSIQPTDVAGLYAQQYQGQLNAYNQAQQNNASIMGSLGGILGGLGGAAMLGFGGGVSNYVPGTRIPYASALAGGLIPV